MEFNTTIDLIIKDLNDACQIIDDLKNYPGVPELQIELAKAKCKSAGEVISLLKNIKFQPITITVDKNIESGSEEITSSEENPPETILTLEQADPVEEKKPPVITSKTRQSPGETQKEPEQNATAEKVEKPHTGSVIIADNFSNMTTRINEQLGTKKGEDDVSGKIKSKHIHNLKDAIGINDKFLLIREVFNGDKEAYDKAIERLENIQSTEDAKAVIVSYTGSNDENDAVKQLLDIVKRKLSPDE